MGLQTNQATFLMGLQRLQELQVSKPLQCQTVVDQFTWQTVTEAQRPTSGTESKQ